MTITSSVQIVYYAPTNGKRYLTKHAAIRAEARAIIKKHFPDERGCLGTGCECGDTGWSMEIDQPKRHARYMRMLTKALKGTME